MATYIETRYKYLLSKTRLPIGRKNRIDGENFNNFDTAGNNIHPHRKLNSNVGLTLQLNLQPDLVAYKYCRTVELRVYLNDLRVGNSKSA